MSVRPPRSESRANFDTPTRLALMEGDMDRMEAKYDDLQRTLTRIYGTNIAILVSLTTGAVLMALNVAVLQ